MARGDKFYFENFAASSALSKKAADYLVKCLETYDANDLQKMLEEMHEIEHNADLKKHEMEAALAKAFVTPVDREDLDMLREALDAGADIIMLDNMSVEDMKEAVRRTAGRAETECSGNVTRENIARLVDIGVDYISSGALTHSAPILDLSLKNLHAV